MIEYFYPDSMGRIILLAMEEILGLDGLNSILRIASLSTYIGHYPTYRPNKTFSFNTVGKLLESLERAYGPQGGRGTALRVGRACFQYGLREYGTLLGFSELAYKLLPFPTRLRTGAKTFAGFFNNQTDQRVQVEENNGKLVWLIGRCPLCWHRSASEPVCHLAVGLLEESLYWLSSGKIFDVEEVRCIARGDPSCTILIDPTPLS